MSKKLEKLRQRLEILESKAQQVREEIQLIEKKNELKEQEWQIKARKIAERKKRKMAVCEDIEVDDYIDKSPLKPSQSSQKIFSDFTRKDFEVVNNEN